MAQKREEFELIEKIKIFAKDVRKNNLIFLDGFPCKVIENLKRRVGRHGPAKHLLRGRDVFTNKIIEDIFREKIMVEKIICKIKYYNLINLEETNLAELEGEQGETKYLFLPLNSVGEKIKENFRGGEKSQILVYYFMGQERIMDVFIKK